MILDSKTGYSKSQTYTKKFRLFLSHAWKKDNRRKKRTFVSANTPFCKPVFTPQQGSCSLDCGLFACIFLWDANCKLVENFNLVVRFSKNI